MHLEAFWRDMKFLFRSGWGESLAIARRVENEGNEVLFSISEEAKEARHVGDGLINKTRDYAASVQWADVVVYDGNTFDLPKEAEKVRQSKPVIGSSAFADKLEHDRPFAIQLVKRCGLEAPAYTSFKGPGAFDKARLFLESHDDGGIVFKPNADPPGIRTFCSESIEEMFRMLDYFERKFEEGKEVPNFLLEDRHEGVEVSTEAWFDGSGWSVPNSTLERNRLMDHNLGEMTGCAGNIIWLYSSLDAPLVRDQLLPLTQELAGRYRGPVDINAIIDRETKRPVFLEFTPRFGYDAIFGLTELVGDVGKLFYDVANGRPYSGPLLFDHFSIGVRFSIPPYPAEAPDVAEGYPVFGFDHRSVDRSVHPVEIRVNTNGEAETTGPDGFLFSVTANGTTIEEARDVVYERLHDLYVPNRRFRTDIGPDAERDYMKLTQMGYVGLGPSGKRPYFGGAS